MSRPSFGLRAVLLTIGIMSLGGCSGLKESLGLNKHAPDEFAVVRRAPLSLPPDYGLRPPRPGESRPQEESTRTAARSALLGVPAPAAPAAGVQAAGAQATGPSSDPRAVSRESGLTAGESAFLAKLGADKTDPSIRATVDREAVAEAADDRTFVDKLMFWRTRVEPTHVVDAKKEQQRLQENAALGKPTTGQGVPTIEREGGTEAKGINIF